jgi:hypothetical protein
MHGDNPASRSGPIAMNRRTFLRVLAFTSAGALAMACGAPYSTPGVVYPPLAATPDIVLPSPQPPDPAAAQTPEPDATLASFLALSALLTGMDEALDPTLGRIYLEALQANQDLAVPVETLLERAGYSSGTGPQDLEAVEASGIFADEATNSVATKIIEYWYSGIYDTPDGDRVVATYVDALAWKLLAITKPLTICAFPGFWARPPANAPRDLPPPEHIDILRPQEQDSGDQGG